MDGKKLSNVTAEDISSLFEPFTGAPASSPVVRAIALQTVMMHAMHCELLDALKLQQEQNRR